MSTTTTRRRSGGEATGTPLVNIDIAALSKLMDVTAYGKGEPLYKIIQPFGTVAPINQPDTCFEGWNATKAGLKDGQCGFAYSNEYEAFSMAIKQDGGVIYASVQHDDKGNPLELSEFKLCVVEVTRDFKIEGEVVMAKGKRLLKALDPEYVGAK